MSWKVLTSFRYTRISQPTMGLYRRGLIHWTDELHKAIGEPARVELLWDPEARRLAVRKAEAPLGFCVRKLARTHQWGIRARGAMKQAGLDDTSTRGDLAAEFEPGVWGVVLP